MFALLLSAALLIPTHHQNAAVQSHHRVSSVEVRTGDTLSALGKKFHMPWQGLYERNKKVIGSNPDLIRPGQKLHLPLRPTRWAARFTRPVVRAVVVSDPQPNPVASSPAPISTGGMSAFESCVINAESGGNPTAYNPASGAGGLFQFLPSTWASLGLGYPGGAQTAPVSVQMEGFNILYARDGTSPWAPYDGC